MNIHFLPKTPFMIGVAIDRHPKSAHSNRIKDFSDFPPYTVVFFVVPIKLPASSQEFRHVKAPFNAVSFQKGLPQTLKFLPMRLVGYPGPHSCNRDTWLLLAGIYVGLKHDRAFPTTHMDG